MVSGLTAIERKVIKVCTTTIYPKLVLVVGLIKSKNYGIKRMEEQNEMQHL